MITPVRNVCIIMLSALVLLSVPAVAGHVFLLTYKNRQFNVERAALPEGQTIVMQPNLGDGIIDVILPVGPGGSGSVAKTGDGHTLILSFKDDSISYKVRQADGKETVFPTRALRDLAQYDTRLSVSGPDGHAANFVVKNYETVVVDSVGPTIDLFGGMIPLADGDFVLYADTHRPSTRPQVTGQSPMRYDRYLYVDVKGPMGHDGLFVVDIGAAKSFVVKDFVPDGQEVVESHMMEYSSAGVRKLKYAPMGATGAVTNIVGSTTLHYLSVGDMILYEANVNVVEGLPEIGGREVDGILGIDLLNAAPYLSLKYSGDQTDGPLISLSTKSIVSDKNTLTLPFATVNELLYVDGKINGKRVHFLLDSGAPNCFLSPEAVKLTNADITSDSVVTYAGGGGQKAEGLVGILKSLTIGDQTVTNQRCAVGEIAPLKRLRKGEAGGLLGNSLFAAFGEIEIDFDNRLVRFVKN